MIGYPHIVLSSAGWFVGEKDRLRVAVGLFVLPLDLWRLLGWCVKIKTHCIVGGGVGKKGEGGRNAGKENRYVNEMMESKVVEFINSGSAEIRGVREEVYRIGKNCFWGY